MQTLNRRRDVERGQPGGRAAPASLDGAASRQGVALADRRSGAVKFWALLGSVALVVILSGWARWIASSDFTPVPKGPDKIPTVDLLFLRGLEVGSALVMVALVWHCIVKPLRVQRRISFDGKLLLAGMCGYFVDQFLNVYNTSFNFNAYGVNRGSWGRFIPGMAAPMQGRAAEGLVWAWAMYTYFVVAAAMAGSWLLRRLERRFPDMSRAGLWSVAFAVFFVADLVIELPLFVYHGVYAYTGVPKALALFAGRPYQFPIYESVFVGFVSLGATWLRESRDDRGRSRVERGLDDLRIGTGAKEAVSFAAVTGFTVCLLMGAYFIPFSWMSMQSDTYPKLPSYLMSNAYCGNPGTPNPCPSQLVNPKGTITVTPGLGLR